MLGYCDTIPSIAGEDLSEILTCQCCLLPTGDMYIPSRGGRGAGGRTQLFHALVI